jgi:hypothetical protein
MDGETCPFGCKMRETTEHFALECGPTKQILTILGIELTGVCGLPSILDEAKNRCPFHKKKAWDIVVTALFNFGIFGC